MAKGKKKGETTLVKASQKGASDEAGKALEVLKVPVRLDGYGFRKTQDDWAITFALEHENLKYGQPLQSEMNEHFILFLVKVKSKKEADELVAGEGLGDIELDSEDLCG